MAWSVVLMLGCVAVGLLALRGKGTLALALLVPLGLLFWLSDHAYAWPVGVLIAITLASALALTRRRRAVQHQTA